MTLDSSGVSENFPLSVLPVIPIYACYLFTPSVSACLNYAHSMLYRCTKISPEVVVSLRDRREASKVMRMRDGTPYFRDSRTKGGRT